MLFGYGPCRRCTPGSAIPYRGSRAAGTAVPVPDVAAPQDGLPDADPRDSHTTTHGYAPAATDARAYRHARGTGADLLTDTGRALQPDPYSDLDGYLWLREERGGTVGCGRVAGVHAERSDGSGVPAAQSGPQVQRPHRVPGGELR